VHDAGPLGLKTIYERAGLPNALFPAFRVAVDVARDLRHEGLDQDSDRFSRTVIERVLTRAEAAPEDDAEYLLEQITKLQAATAGTRLRRAAQV
jgi:hypothetical protein